MKANMDIRRELKEANIPLWRLGQIMRCSEMTMVRRLRTELSEAEKNVIRQLIKEIIEEETEDEITMNDYAKLKELRCDCGKLLGKCDSKAEIDCPRCDARVTFKNGEIVSKIPKK